MDTLNANWSAPPHVYAMTTTRKDGFSLPPYESNNLATHVGDIESDVCRNRQLLIETLNLPSMPEWLDQTHSTRCVVVEDESNRQADAAITRQPNTVLAILTADCLPIVITNKQGTEIAAIHAGWRGLAEGIIDVTINKMRSSNSDLIAWIGPAICQKCYETGNEVQKAFLNHYPFTSSAFHYQQERLYANLPKLAELILNDLGVKFVSQSNECTYESNHAHVLKQFYSYRYEQQTGRIATLIWFRD